MNPPEQPAPGIHSQVPETSVSERLVLHNAEPHDLKIREAIGDEVPASDATEDAYWAESWICCTRYTNYE